MTYTDVMLDLETWGTAPGCALRSIGARLFNIAGPSIDDENELRLENWPIVSTMSDDRRFYCNVDPHSCRLADLSVDPETEKWWREQSQEAQAALVDDQIPVGIAIDALAGWWPKGLRVWSHGASFDIPILKHVWQRMRPDTAMPWQFYDERDTRTVLHIAKALNFDKRLDAMKEARTVQQVRHHALHDCEYQIRLMQACWQIIVPPPRKWWRFGRVR